MQNGRCRMPCGASTGPRTPEGRARSRRANWKHGRYSAEARAERARLRREAESTAGRQFRLYGGMMSAAFRDSPKAFASN